MTEKNLTTDGKALKPSDRIKAILTQETINEQFKNALKENSSLFVASLIELYTSDKYLAKCDAGLVVLEALKAATLKLPINRNLGFAWIIPYGGTPSFQLGWKGYVQLAQRSDKYKTINCNLVYDGELISIDKLSGDIDISGTAATDKIIGHFAFFELINGFKKTSYWTVEKTKAHAVKYNQECKKAGKLVGNWKDHFDSRAMTTVLKHLIKNFGPQSVEMMGVDISDERDLNQTVNDDVDANANADAIDITPPKKAAAKKATGKEPAPSCLYNDCDNNNVGQCAAGFQPDDENCVAYRSGPNFTK